MTSQTPVSARLQLVVFWVNIRRCALDILGVREIRRPSRDPGATPQVDLHARFGCPRGEPTEATRIVVVEAGGSAFGLVADRVEEVMWVDRTAIDPPSDADHGLAIGAVPSADGRIMLLDPDALSAERAMKGISTHQRAA